MATNNLTTGNGTTVGPVSLNAATFNDVAIYPTGGLANVLFTGSVGANGAMTDLIVYTTSGDQAPMVAMLVGTGGDFGAVTDFLAQTTASPHTTAANGSFQFRLGLAKCTHAVKIAAKGANTTLIITARGDQG